MQVSRIISLRATRSIETLAATIVLLTLGLMGYALAQTLPSWVGTRIGSGYVPRLFAAAALVSAAGHLIAASTTAPSKQLAVDRTALIATFGAGITGAVLLPLVGLPLGIGAAAVVFASARRAGWRAALLAGAVTALVVTGLGLALHIRLLPQ